jgi:hypothetical protein
MNAVSRNVPILFLLLPWWLAAATAQAREAGPDAASTVPAGVVVADEAPVRAGARAHDGFFLRLTAGPGYAATIGRGTAAAGDGGRDQVDPEFQGLSLNGVVDIGAEVAPDWLLHAEILIEAQNRRAEGDWLEAGWLLTGVGATRYFMPHNLFVTGALGLATTWYVVHSEVPRSEGSDETRDLARTDVATGVGAVLTLGKEWWVSDNWGLGIAVQGTYAFCRNDDIRFHNAGARVLMTATFN